MLADLLAGCALLGAVVVGCDARADGYREAAARVPAAHWALVRAVKIADGTRGRAARGGTIRLPWPPRDRVLFHEVGHIVSYQDGGTLLDGWYAAFWAGDRPHGRLPSRYARQSVSEDFAESYRRWIEDTLGECCPERAVWLQERWP